MKAQRLVAIDVLVGADGSNQSGVPALNVLVIS